MAVVLMTRKRSKPLACLVASRHLGTTCATQTVTSSYSADRRNVLCRNYTPLSRVYQVRHRYLMSSPMCMAVQHCRWTTTSRHHMPSQTLALELFLCVTEPA
ncbi:hypothetical protein EDB85DRAFT_1985467 [Lactarius pseudohatsudake]|nr:hypothetical protein EDB85DRAFT_1985467 [Lactarius pseudohatsudake]